MAGLTGLYEQTITEFGDIRTKQIGAADPYGVDEARRRRSMETLEAEIKKFPGQLTARALAALEDLGIETQGQTRLKILIDMWEDIGDMRELRSIRQRRDRWEQDTKDPNMPIPGEPGFVSYVLAQGLGTLFPGAEVATETESSSSVPPDFRGTAQEWADFKVANPDWSDKELIQAWNKENP